MPFNEHPSYPAFEITVCKADTVDEDMDTMYIYILSDQNGMIRYVGHTKDIQKRMAVNSTPNHLESPLYRHLRENGIDGWSIHEYACVRYDTKKCADAYRRAEDDCMAVMRSQGCQLLNKNCALRNDDAGESQRAWREAHGQGTPNSYMANYCRAWRTRKKLEREQAEQAEAMVGAE